MQNQVRFPTQLQYSVVLLNPTTKFLQIPLKFHLLKSARLDFGGFQVKSRSEYFCNALGTKKEGSFSLKETDGSDEFEDEDFDDEFLDYSETDDGGGGGGNDEDEVVIPMKNMKQWLENRPRGFGEGKEYDTSIEDKLMEEIEQSRIAQLANVNKLKNSPVKPIPKKDKVPQLNHDGFRVRLVNLPRKKNIHRDLKVAFQGVPGIVKIVPVVSGNEKTRDPVCKGLAFIDFKNKDDAQRFVKNFSGKPVFFGKVEKQIECKMVEPKVPKLESDQQRDSSPDEDRRVGYKADIPVSYSLEDGFRNEIDDAEERQDNFPNEIDDGEERHVSVQQQEDDGGINSTTSISDSADEPGVEKSAVNSSSLKQIRKAEKQPKKVAQRKVKGNAPKLNIPGSAKKLKSRDQELLSGVFSKYGTAAATATTINEQSR